jgi:PTS system ascorbate-specific IIB component
MKIVCVCGMGMGSSLILKMSVEKAMSELGVPCDVDHWSAGTIDSSFDIIVAAEDFRDELVGRNNTVFVKNVVKVPEVKESLTAYLKKKNLL